MKGLFRKDFYQYRKYCCSYLPTIILFLLLGILVYPKNMFMIIYPAVLIGMMPLTLMSYEEKEKWDVYSRLLPYPVSWLVSVKYLAVLLMELIFVTIAAGLLVLKLYTDFLPVPAGISGQMTDYSLSGLVAILISAGLLGTALIFPFCFRVGVEKARLIRVVYTVLYFSVGGVLGELMEQAGEGYVSVLNWLGKSTLPLVAVIVSMIIFCLSWMLSIKWYKEKEF